MSRISQSSESVESKERTAPLQIAGVSERDIDLLLLEEFIASDTFAFWFLKKVGLDVHSAPRVIYAQRSVTQSVGESDLLVAIAEAGGDIHYLLIENKIAASFQPRQAARYRERGHEYQVQGLCKTYSTVLIAPDDYLGTTASRHDFDAVLRYEDILLWFGEQSALGSRAAYKQVLLSSAISKAKYGYQPIEDAAVTDFWKGYWRLAIDVAPELEMAEPKAKPSRSSFIYFRPGTLPSGVAIVHKLSHGFLDLQFANMGKQLSRLRVEFGSALIPGMTIERAANSGVIRLKVPLLYTGCPFSEQAKTARICLEQAAELLKWYRQVTGASDVRSNTSVQRTPASGCR